MHFNDTAEDTVRFVACALERVEQEPHLEMVIVPVPRRVLNLERIVGFSAAPANHLSWQIGTVDLGFRALRAGRRVPASDAWSGANVFTVDSWTVPDRSNQCHQRSALVMIPSQAAPSRSLIVPDALLTALRVRAEESFDDMRYFALPNFNCGSDLRNALFFDRILSWLRPGRWYTATKQEGGLVLSY